jgi:hypothetical protein
LEREIANLGVAPKQTDKARQSFERSARQAGFFLQGEDRLVQPRFGKESAPPAKETSAESIPTVSVQQHGGGGGDPPSDRPLEYQLIDLLKRSGIGDEQRAAIWILIQFLTDKNGPKGAV